MGDGTPKSPHLAIGLFVKSLAKSVKSLSLLVPFGPEVPEAPRASLYLILVTPFFHFSLSHYFFSLFHFPSFEIKFVYHISK